jgi:hypothetical protein
VCRLISNALRAGWFSPLDDAGFWAFDNGKFMEQNSEIVFKGTTVEIDGDKWVIILIPLKRGYSSPFSLKNSVGQPVDVESFCQKFFGQFLVFATRGDNGQYEFSVPPFLANRIRSKIPPDFVWSEMHFPL